MSSSLLRSAAAFAAAIALALTPTATSEASGLPNRSSPAVVIAPVAPAVSADPSGRVRGTMIMIHGGGWVGHDARAQEHLMSRPGALFLQRGWRVVSIDYRAGAQGLQDVLDAGAAELARGTGEGPLCLYGESSGGHLALVAASRLRAVDCVIGLGAPTDLVHYQAEAGAGTEPRAKLVAGRIARYFGTTPGELAPWDPVTLAPSIRADVVLLREGDDAVFSAAHAWRVQAARPTTQVVELPAGDPSDLSTALLHGTVSSIGRVAYGAALGASADRAVAFRRAERVAARTRCPLVTRSIRHVGLRGLRDALRCLARRRSPSRRVRRARWRGTDITLRGEINAARIWSTLRASDTGVRALSMLAGGRARIIVRTGQRSRVMVVPATPARGAR